MRNKKMIVRREILVGIIVLICIGNISAFAISSDYWYGHPMAMQPSESREFFITLQNLGGSSDLRLKAIVSTGSSVLRLADPSNIYVVPAGEKEQANFVATLPADAKPGQVYNVKIDFAEVKDSKSGEFGFGTAIGQSFDIIAFLPPTEPSKTPVIIAILSIAAGVALIVVITWILKKIKKKKSHRKHGKRRR